MSDLLSAETKRVVARVTCGFISRYIAAARNMEERKEFYEKVLEKIQPSSRDDLAAATAAVIQGENGGFELQLTEQSDGIWHVCVAEESAKKPVYRQDLSNLVVAVLSHNGIKAKVAPLKQRSASYTIVTLDDV